MKTLHFPSTVVCGLCKWVTTGIWIGCGGWGKPSQKRLEKSACHFNHHPFQGDLSPGSVPSNFSVWLSPHCNILLSISVLRFVPMSVLIQQIQSMSGYIEILNVNWVGGGWGKKHHGAKGSQVRSVKPRDRCRAELYRSLSRECLGLPTFPYFSNGDSKITPRCQEKPSLVLSL